MEFEKIFRGIALSDEAIKRFYETEKLMSERFPEKFEKALEVYFEGDIPFGEYIAKLAKKAEIAVEILNLCIYLKKLQETYAEYREKKLSDKVFFDTMRDITVRCETNLSNIGTYGISQKNCRRWIRNYLDLKVFRIGALNYEIRESKHDIEIDGVKISIGDPCVYVHIPGQEFSEDACEQSYAEAREFLARSFGMNPPVFFCASWLLQPWLVSVLPKSSNIVKFQEKYKIIDFVENQDLGLRFVFPVIRENPEAYPEDTTIRREVKARLIRGEKIGIGYGIRL